MATGYDSVTTQTEQAKCDFCGVEMPRYASNGCPRKYCTPLCRIEANYHHVAKPKLPCARCGKLFASRTGNPRCSRCKAHMGDIEKKCPVCRKPFVAESGRKRHRIYCRKQCEWKANRRRRALTETYKIKAAEYRSKRKAALPDGDRIDPYQVFTRDGWVCQICKKKVDPSLHHTHRRSATIDHIVPISEGGTHTMGNVQLAHRGCNSSKHVKKGFQRRLF